MMLVVEYEGTGYAGWQRQANALSVQEVLEGAVERITGEPAVVQGAGRTDAGVHARGQTVNFRTRSRIPAGQFAAAINSVLPADISIRVSREVPREFQARYRARAKLYSYTVWNQRERSPFQRRYTHHVPEPLDCGLMREGARHLQGRHDFAAFRGATRRRPAGTGRRVAEERVAAESPDGPAGAGVGDAVRNLSKLSVEAFEGLVTFLLQADGFLYHMARNIVGTLLEVGLSRRAPGDLKAILESGDRRLAGPTAPACGLCLEAVYYDQEIIGNEDAGASGKS
ncbi:MAG: tRNA pseudouridine(38-40) synthase TruA [Firmicutes bacterium]|nr:tRNA pseudouridine(38-40) synthase TruA [Bacillota bacterium]